MTLGNNIDVITICSLIVFITNFETTIYNLIIFIWSNVYKKYGVTFMSSKVINIMPDIPKVIVEQCETLAKSCPDDIYKIFIGFPLLFPYGEEFRPIALLITTSGIIFYTDHPSKIDNEEVFLKSRLLQHEYLRRKTDLRFKIVPIAYNNSVDIVETAVRIIKSNDPDKINIETMRFIESALTGMLTKNNFKTYEENDDDSPEVKAIKKIDFGVATFDNKQYECIEARSDFKISAIRGLAGCGKTVVLCKIAANEIYRDKDIKICYTYQTRSMYGQVKSRVKDFLNYSGIEDVESAMERIDIIGSWGGFNNPGLLNNVCHELNLQALDLEESRLLNFSNPFLGFCEYVLNAMGDKNLPMYDYILIDEAQDLNPSFLRICYKILKPKGKLIYAYDDFQTLSETTLPSPSEIFPEEKSIHTFPLSICYRTPPKTLSLAHALSMGIYCDPPTFYQFPSSPSDWEAMGYVMEKGNGTVGQKTVLSREGPDIYNTFEISAMQAKSPAPGESSFSLLAHKLFDDIQRGMSPEDILVVDLDGSSLDYDYQRLHDEIHKLKQNTEEPILKTYFAGSLNPNTFRKKGCVTFSGVKRAKGNEAFRVYLLNAAKTMSQQFPIVWRNRLFTAITRTRLQVVFVNSNDDNQINLTQKLFDEMRRAKSKHYKLEFDYPSDKEIKKIIKTAKTEEKVMNEVETISSKLKQVEKMAGNDKVLDVLGEVILSNLSEEDKEKLFSILKGTK